METKIDPETERLKAIAKALKEMTDTDGWKIARERLVEKITFLQNAFDISDSTPEEMVRELKARKIATTLLFDWLKTDIEGEVLQAETNLPKQNNSYIVKRD